jgi:hypothetical protein
VIILGFILREELQSSLWLPKAAIVVVTDAIGPLSQNVFFSLRSHLLHMLSQPIVCLGGLDCDEMQSVVRDLYPRSVQCMTLTAK